MKNKKPLWIALGALAGVFLIAALIAVIAGIANHDPNEANRPHKSAEDAPYPYAWEEKEGVITLTLTSKGLENGAWTQNGAGILGEVELGTPEGESTVVTIRPVEIGRENLSFLLTDGNDLVAEAIFTLEVERLEDERLSASISAHEERLLQKSFTGGTDSDYPFTITSENGALLLTVFDPALAEAFAENDDTEQEPERAEEATDAVTEPEPADESAAEAPVDGSTAETPDDGRTVEEPDLPEGSALSNEDAAEIDNSDYYDDLDYDEESNSTPAPTEEQGSELASDHWHITTTDNLVAQPVLVNIDREGITYRIETEMYGEATVTLFNSKVGVTYVFSLVSSHQALTVSGYQAGEELPADPASREELGQTIADLISGMEVYTPPAATEEPLGDQDDGLGLQEQQDAAEETGDVGPEPPEAGTP